MPASKRFLVIVRAGDRSLHPGWTNSVSTRNWDLIASYFGSDPELYRTDGEVRIDDQGPKWPGLHALLTRDQRWRDYDYVWLPDDDLAIDETRINRLFALVASSELQLAQPTLSWVSFYSYEQTLRHPSFRLRYTNFVEVMAPCFESSFLARCLPTLAENQSGWGLGYVWARTLADPARGCAMIDEVELTHTRPVGGPNMAAVLATGSTPKAEYHALLRKHSFPARMRPVAHAGIDIAGNLLTDAEGENSSLRALLHRDRQAFLASRLRLDLGSAVLPVDELRVRAPRRNPS